MSHIYYSRLDGIRFIAIIMVIIAHFASSISRHISSAFYGVNLFFVLSGYLITGILIASKNNSFKHSYFNFVLRRALRIFPAYYLSLFILFLIGEDFIQNDMPYLLTYSYNYFIDHSKPLPSHVFYWSLAVEEQFYLIFPLIVIALKKHIQYLIIIILIIISLAYLQVFTNLFNLKEYDYVGLLTNMAPLSIGALGAFINKNSCAIKKIFENIYIELFLFTILFISLNKFNFEFKILFCSIINLFIILKASMFEFRLNFINKFLSNNIVTNVGKVSYGIYLYHGVVGKFVTKHLFNPIWEHLDFKKYPNLSFLYDWDWIFRIILVTITSTTIAMISFKYFESIFLKFKDKYFKN